ncbi:hypothetical protein ACI8AC_13330 [Geodermatophilus sp. SYSU D00758]
MAAGASRTPPRAVLASATAAVLVAWGGANVVLGSAALAGVLTPAGGIDPVALRWHVALWDAWFLVWGLTLAVAVVRTRGGTPAGEGPADRDAAALSPAGCRSG